MLFFTPRYLKHGRQYIKDARKLVAFKRDLVSDEAVAGVEREISHLEAAISKREKAEVEAQMQRLDEACGALTKPMPDAAWRENVEVFLVAIVIALAVRTYFLQPFTIPTGSMQPTLNGILVHKTEEAPPNVLFRIVEKAVLGRTYFDVVAQADEQVLWVSEVKRFLVFTYTRLETSAHNTYWIHAPQEVVTKNMLAPVGRDLKKGQVIARGYLDTGDHVFVDKVTYHFRKPSRGEVFVFSTAGIERLTEIGAPSQYFIKRLAGVPGDTLRIDAPKLFVNGEEAKEAGFQRVMSGTMNAPTNGYRGYAHGWEYEGQVNKMRFLTSPQETFTVPQKSYFALGDNSYNSKDSRDWSTVPQGNLMGRAVFVYWPFGSHWSLIR